MRSTWKLLNSVINKTRSSNDAKNFLINNSLTNDPALIVKSFNDYFVHIGPDLAKTIPTSFKKFDDFLPPSISSSMVLLPTDECEISNIIKSLKNSASPGLDEIPPSVVKFACSFIVTPLVNLINCSMSKSIFPSKLKQAKVVPIFKSGNATMVCNYRPISILNIFSKIYEKVLYKRLLSFLTTNNFFFDHQFGFREGHSTSMALITLVHYITAVSDANETTISVFVDLSKAFDTLNHDILLHKLEHFGIRGSVLQLFENYLHGRNQCASDNGVFSDCLPITCGVPQGSILGPLLFLLCINDIHKSSTLLKFILFADDTTVLFKSKSLSELFRTMNHELKTVSEWFKANKLSLNISKTNFIVFKKSIAATSSFSVNFDNIQVKQVSSVKFLGVEIDSNLAWKDQISKVEKKISSAIGVVSKVRFKITNKTALLLYDALIASQLNYCNIVWAATYKSSLDRLYVLQKRALRICFHKKKLCKIIPTV